MGWRTDFLDHVIERLKEITDIGDVRRDWDEAQMEYPSLIVNMGEETYERTLGESEGVTTMGFRIFGKIQSGDSDRYEDLDDLVDDVIQALEGITAYDVIVETTTFHERIGGNRLTFETEGHAVIAKDFSSM